MIPDEIVKGFVAAGPIGWVALLSILACLGLYIDQRLDRRRHDKDQEKRETVLLETLQRNTEAFISTREAILVQNASRDELKAIVIASTASDTALRETVRSAAAERQVQLDRIDRRLEAVLPR